ncbi:MAG: nucleotidyltransferase family protein [Firmicutes bacterium]|nr:nucleotidyltransferase family protein [Bacillota bacterium]
MKSLEEIKHLLAEVKPLLKDRYKVREVRLFGSFVRGEQTEESDLDVLVGFDQPVSLLDLAALEIFLNDLLGIRVDVVPQEDLREELRGYILKEALPL